MAIDPVRFPEVIARHAKGGPRMSSSILQSAGGGEQRIALWSGMLSGFTISSGFKRATDLDTLEAFFRAREGDVRGFLFKNWRDYQAEDQVLGTGDGAETIFWLKKNYTSGGRTVSKRITRPVAGSVTVKLNGVPQPSGWSLGANGAAAGGKITFTAAPGAGVIVSASCEFDLPARFDLKDQEIDLTHFDLGEWPEIRIVEIQDE